MASISNFVGRSGIQFFSSVATSSVYILFIVGKLLFLNGYTGISAYQAPVLESIGFDTKTVPKLLMALGIRDISLILTFMDIF